MHANPADMEKQFLEEKQVLLDSFRLGVDVYRSGFHPSFIIGIWRGGSSVGIYVQECLQTLGIDADHIAIRTSYQGQPDYADMVAEPENRIQVHGTTPLLDKLNTEDRLLIVDDVYSTGHSIQAVRDRLRHRLRRNCPAQIRVATLFQRTGFRAAGNRPPDFCLHDTVNWLVFPYEMAGLDLAEIARHKPWLLNIMNAGPQD